MTANFEEIEVCYFFQYHRHPHFLQFWALVSCKCYFCPLEILSAKNIGPVFSKVSTFSENFHSRLSLPGLVWITYVLISIPS